MQVLYRQQDDVSAEEEKTMEGLKWLRPSQISMKPDVVGFTELNKEPSKEALASGGDPAKLAECARQEHDDLAGAELADFRRISYGTILEDRWLLNAASLVAQE